MCEHEDRRVIRRVVAPPAFPGLVPRPSAAAEHLAAHDVRLDIRYDLVDNHRIFVVGATL